MSCVDRVAHVICLSEMIITHEIMVHLHLHWYMVSHPDGVEQAPVSTSDLDSIHTRRANNIFTEPHGQLVSCYKL